MGTKANLTAAAVSKNLPAYPGRKQSEAITTFLLGDVLVHYAGRSVQRLLGFWVLVNAVGGFEELIASGIISRAGVYTQRKEFRQLFGVEAVEWEPELSADFPSINGRPAMFPAKARS